MTKEKVKCPDCDQMFYPSGLGPHRKTHKPEVKKVGSTTVYKRLVGEFPCTVEGCTFVGKWQGGLTKHMRTHKAVRRSKSIAKFPTEIEVSHNGVSQESHFVANGIAEATLALALGRFQGLCQSMAFEFDIPPKLFYPKARRAYLPHASTVITSGCPASAPAAMSARRVTLSPGTAGAGWRFTR